MFDLQASFDTLNEWGDLLRHHLPVDHWPNPVVWSGVAVLAGVVLAFWGARLLRTIYVLAFVVIGGTIGVRSAGVRQVDVLIGLILGAGVGAALAFIFFRWWVGLTTGLLAVMLLLLAGAPRLNAEFTSFSDARLGVGSGDWPRSLRVPEIPKTESWEQIQQFAGEFSRYVLEQRRTALVQATIGLGLVWLLGTAAGLLLPRLVTVTGTSLVGVLMLAVGAKVLLSTHWPGAWSAILTNRNWFMVGLAGMFLAALSYQARHRRGPITVATPVPATA